MVAKIQLLLLNAAVWCVVRGESSSNDVSSGSCVSTEVDGDPSSLLQVLVGEAKEKEDHEHNHHNHHHDDDQDHHHHDRQEDPRHRHSYRGSRYEVERDNPRYDPRHDRQEDPRYYHPHDPRRERPKSAWVCPTCGANNRGSRKSCFKCGHVHGHDSEGLTRAQKHKLRVEHDWFRGQPIDPSWLD